MEVRSVYLSHKPGGSIVTLPSGRRRIVASSEDLATALRDALEIDPVELDPEPAGRRITVEAVDGGLVASVGVGEVDSTFVLPTENGTEAAAQLWDALTAASPGKWLHDAERLAFEEGDDEDRVSVPIGDVVELNVTRGQLRTGARGVRSMKSFFQFLSRPGPKAKARKRKRGADA